MKNNKGFSLVELIVVIAIMAILAAIAIPTFATFITRANVATDVDFMNSVEYAAELACAGEALKATNVKVVLSAEKGTAASVVVTVRDGDESKEYTIIQENNTGATDEEKAFKNLIAGSIDWTYKFKTNSDKLIENEKWKDADSNDGVIWTITAPAGSN